MRSAIRLIAFFAVLLFPALTFAQQKITCASGPRGQRNYCAADTRGGVVLVRKISGPCQQGVNWGFDARGIWVQGGCAADFQVRRYAGGPWWWDSGPGYRPSPWRGTGACFYRNPNFSGPYFCLAPGDRVARMPSGFDNAITSIQVLRANGVRIYSGDNFRGNSVRIANNVPNLRNWRIPGSNGTWNNRISSIRVD
jgi:Protein of unknown function (DUF3011)